MPAGLILWCRQAALRNMPTCNYLDNAMKRICNALKLLACIALLLPQLALAANDKALFWQLQADNARLYLFGSIHLADDSFYPLRDEIEAAFERSDALAVEADIHNADRFKEFQLISKYGMYPAGETLVDHISDATYQQLQEALQSHRAKLPLQFAVRLRPGWLMVALGYLAAENAGLNMRHGLDLHFLKRASAENKKIIELEGSEQLLKMMSGIGPAEEVVKAAIEQLNGNGTGAVTARMVELWKKGDEQALERLLIAEMGGGGPAPEGMLDIFLYDRNHRMADKIQGLIKQGGNYFVVVGAAHLVGDKGVPALLGKQGFKVERR